MEIISDFKRFKHEPLVMVTAYDYPFAKIVDEAGADIILVGDSLANVVLGKPSTRDIDMNVMEIFVSAVCRGAQSTHITADMPFGSYENTDDALINAKKLLSLGAHSVKFEGFHPDIMEVFQSEKVSFMGHLGLLPQTAVSLKQVGAGQTEKDTITQQALEIQKAGAFSLVLEHMDFELATTITQRLDIPTIGIGAGPQVNGQVLVLHDLLGMRDKPLPPFAKKFADIYGASLKGLTDYVSAVRQSTFPE